MQIMSLNSSNNNKITSSSSSSSSQIEMIQIETADTKMAGKMLGKRRRKLARRPEGATNEIPSIRMRMSPISNLSKSMNSKSISARTTPIFMLSLVIVSVIGGRQLRVINDGEAARMVPSIMDSINLPTSATSDGSSGSSSSISSSFSSSLHQQQQQQVSPPVASSLVSAASKISKRDLTSANRQQLQSSEMPTAATATTTTTKLTDTNGGSRGRATTNVCQVNDGESVAILEIEESRGLDQSQPTSPSELPISGSPELGEIELRIESETHKYFQIQDKRLKLIRPLDRDNVAPKENSTSQVQQQQPISSIYLQVSCIDKRFGQAPTQNTSSASSSTTKQFKKVIIPVLVKVLDLNDNAPKFTKQIYTVQVDELTPVGAIILDQIHAVDFDSTNNGQVEYNLVVGSSTRPSSTSAVGPSSTSQRLIQRAPTSPPTAQLQTTSTQQPITGTTSNEQTTSSLNTSDNANKMQTDPSPSSSSSANQPITIATTTGTGGASQQQYPSTSSHSAITQIPPITTTTSSVSLETSSTASSTPVVSNQSPQPRLAVTRTSSGPTIDLGSEPILNGPMEESETEGGDDGDEEAESDEALLASFNNSTGDNSEEELADSSSSPSFDLSSDSTSLSALSLTSVLPGNGRRVMSGAGGGSTGKRRKRKRRHSYELSTDRQVTPAPLIMTTTTTANNNNDRLPWTNLMAAGEPNTVAYHDSGPYNVEDDSDDYFSLEFANNQTNRPVIRLKKSLDYETKRVHYLTIMATDLATNKLDRLTSYATIVVRVLDGDDQPPAFVLDQSGCATNSIPQATTTTPSSLLVATSTSQATRQVQTIAPGDFGDSTLKGFKVSDENFDFGDALGLDDNPIEDTHRPTKAKLSSVSMAPLNQQQQRERSHPLQTTPSPYHQCLTEANTNSGQAEYFSTIMSGDSGYLLRIAPQSIKARDRDELNAPIRYSFINATLANYLDYFQINPLDAGIKQIKPIELNQENKKILMWIQAQEQSPQKLFSLAKLTIDVLSSTKSPPILVPNSYSGFIEENSPIGSRIRVIGGDTREQQQMNQTVTYLRINVLDADDHSASGKKHNNRFSPSSSSSSRLTYDFETTSDAFKVDRDGFVYVNKSPLDRDAPNQAVHMFQVTAQQVGIVSPSSSSSAPSPSSSSSSSGSSSSSARTISSPISLNVTLLDLNDNPPVFLNHTLGSLQMASNSRGGIQQLTQLRATDRDLPGENSRMHFSIRHVSNNGKDRFRIDEDSGRIEAIGKFAQGEQFSLTVQVSDDLQRSSQGILDIQVVPGANTGGPQFVDTTSGGGGNTGEVVLLNSHGYSVEVNEGVALNSVVLQVHAIDPENDPVTYSLVGGNINNDFSINSKSGLLSVANKLDREEISGYSLLVQARDSGGLATSRPIHITITDSNDQNPIFGQSTYEFEVHEGVAEQVIGRVTASDADLGENARLVYSLEVMQHQQKQARNRHHHHHHRDRKNDHQHQSSLFSIDEQTGDIKVLEPLDYEETRIYILLVTARDNGENPRSSSATVQVRVLDVQDEAPYFDRLHLESRLDENQANQKVALVQAHDPDSKPQINYVLLAGDSSLFEVNPQTGLVTTLRGLDYEQSRSHTLLIGTNESLTLDLVDISTKLSEAIAAAAAASSGRGQQQDSNHGQAIGTSSSLTSRWPVVRVDVQVNDLNDNAPQFESVQPLPMRIQDSAPLGTHLIRLKAIDLDGSAPNNLVRYELVLGDLSSITTSDIDYSSSSQQATSAKCASLFMVDPISGSVSVRSELKRESQSECQLVVRASDLSQLESARLSSTVSLTIFIDHLAEISASSMIGFADTSFTVEVSENMPANSLIKVIPVINKPKISFPMSCEIISGNELGRFYVMENELRDCELKTRDNQLDYESRARYNLVLRLNTIGTGGLTGGGGNGNSNNNNINTNGPVSPPRTIAQVQVNILDRNDNRPIFQLPSRRYSHLTQNRYLTAISSDSPSDTQVIQLRASDADASGSHHSNGLVSFELLNEQELEGRFRVDLADGIVRTSRPIEDIPSTRLPIKLRIIARDNPEQPSDTLDSTAEVVLNLIDDKHRLALVLKDTPAGRVSESKEELLGVIQERTGLIAGLERIESLKFQRNSSSPVEPDVGGTDFWFYLIEPGTMRIVASDDPRIKAGLFDSRAQKSLFDVIGQTLGFTKARIRLPYSLGGFDSVNNQLNHRSPSSGGLLLGAIRGADTNDRLAPALILIALFIAIISAITVIYQCGSAAGWTSASNNLNTMPHHHAHQQQQAAMLAALSQNPPPDGKLLYGGLPMPVHYQASNGSQTPSRLVQDPYHSMRSAFSTLNNGHQQPMALLANNQRQLDGMDATNNSNNNNNCCLNEGQKGGVMSSKEYETQMLKMSVLFDDSQSVDDRNFSESRISTKNLV